jgi:hypothetical protein
MATPSSVGAGRRCEVRRVSRSLSLAVVVPTFRRPDHLRDCLCGLAHQVDPPDEIIIVVRPVDNESRGVIRAMTREVPNLREALVDEPGLVAALKCGVEHTRSDLVAFTDDDAVPPPAWTRALRAAFDAPDVGLVGGRDIIDGTGPPDRSTVGMIGNWGRMVGNHHRGAGPPRNVDVLKGVNMAARAAALSLPLGFRGRGAQPHSEVAICMEAARRGWRVVYDPAITVDHFPGDRIDGDDRDLRGPESVFDEAFNYQASLAGIRPWLGTRALTYGVLVGTTRNPGVARWIVAMARRERPVAGRVGPAVRGRLAGYWAGRTGGLRVWRPASRGAGG